MEKNKRVIFDEMNERPLVELTQIALLRENIYRYYGVNEKILNSTFSEAEWNSFYEAMIEPISIQLSLKSYPNKHIVHLAKYHKSKRIRKKNINKIEMDFK